MELHLGSDVHLLGTKELMLPVKNIAASTIFGMFISVTIVHSEERLLSGYANAECRLVVEFYELEEENKTASGFKTVSDWLEAFLSGFNFSQYLINQKAHEAMDFDDEPYGSKELRAQWFIESCRANPDSRASFEAVKLFNLIWQAQIRSRIQELKK